MMGNVLLFNTLLGGCKCQTQEQIDANLYKVSDIALLARHIDMFC